DEDVAGGGELRLDAIDIGGVPGGDAVGRAVDEERQGLGGLELRGAEDDGVEVDAVAHGDSDLLAEVFAVVVEPSGGGGEALLFGDDLAGGVEGDAEAGDGAG